MGIYEQIEEAIAGLPDEVNREWTWYAPYDRGYPQRVVGNGSAVLICETYDDPSTPVTQSLAYYLSLVSPANIQKLLLELKAAQA